MEDREPENLSTDEAYDLTSQELRRKSLGVLLDERDEWDVESLAREVAAREDDVPAEDVDEETHERVTVALVHRDLPKLADADVVVFDAEAETVAAGEHIADLEPFVDGE